jgi:hypothetical protein
MFEWLELVQLQYGWKIKILQSWNGLNVLELTVKLASSTDEIFVVRDSSLDKNNYCINISTVMPNINQ